MIVSRKRPYVSRKRPYVGFKNVPEDADETLRELLTAASKQEAAEKTQGVNPTYHKVMGPFKTLRGAQTMIKHGHHVLKTVAAAEAMAHEANG